MKQKLTPWFPSSVKPVHVGWYQCKCCYLKFWFDGKKWMTGHGVYDMESALPVSWRGLADKPE